MTDERDPQLQALFDAASRNTANDAFVTRVMADIDMARRRTVLGWLAFGILMAPVAWWLSAPITSLFDLVAQLLPERLVAVEEGWLAQLTAPANSAAGVAGLLIFAGWMFYRKILSR
jgi:hypothetical protein